jgi:putative aldouronate transport system substrate-binding protein
MMKKISIAIAIAVAIAIGAHAMPGADQGGATASSNKTAVDFSVLSPNALTTVTYLSHSASAGSGILGGPSDNIHTHMRHWMNQNGLEIDMWSYSADRVSTSMSSGDFPDVFVLSDANYEIAIQANYLLPMEDYLTDLPSYSRMKSQLDPALNYMRQYKSANTGKIWGMPTSISADPVAEAQGPDRYGLFFEWDTFAAIGAPKINTLEDTIPVLKQMLAKKPRGASGEPTFGTVLAAGQDAQYWGNMQLYFGQFGYLMTFMPWALEADMINGTLKDITADDSKYYAGLKFYNTLMREGLMDPDSISLDRTVQDNKVKAYNVMMPMGVNQGLEPNELRVLMPGQKLYWAGASPLGAGNKICLNAKLASNPKQLAAALMFVDLLMNPESMMWWRDGAPGDMYYIDGNNAFLQPAYLAWLKAPTGDRYVLPSTGYEISLWNMNRIFGEGVLTKYGDGKGGYRQSTIYQWPDQKAVAQEDPHWVSWRQLNPGYQNFVDMLAKNNAWVKTSTLEPGGLSLTLLFDTPSTALQLTIDAVKNEIVNDSWQMVYAKTDAEFNQIWQTMKTRTAGLGIKQVQDWAQQQVTKAQGIAKSLGL